MRKRIGVFVATLCFTAFESSAQHINFRGLADTQRHFIHVNAGWDYGVTFGIGYSYLIRYKVPVLLNFSYTFPSGEKLFDDFKLKLGGRVRLFEMNSIQVSASVHGIYRRYENPLVRLQNLGTEMTAAVGCYRPKWFVTVEAGFDKAIVSHFRHSETFRQTVYASVKDGWYEPSTGGNFNCGILAGYSCKRSDLTLRIGKVITQDLKTTPLIPYYLQIGFNFKANRRRSSRG
jgi:hypothetical protein